METRAVRLRGPAAYLFTNSKWQAIAYVSGQGRVALEAGNPELRSRFPLKVVQQVEYGMMKAGMSCLAVDYQDTGGEWLGAILYVTFGNMLAGCYAIRAKGRDQEQTSSQMPVRAKQAGSIN